MIGAVGATVAIVVAFAMPGAGNPVGRAGGPATRGDPPVALHNKPFSYIGLFTPDAPQSYAGVTAFTAATGVRPDLALYYSGWLEPFQTSFAAAAAAHGAVPIVQLDPKGISLAAIASGQYDNSYLEPYAEAVRAYHHPVVLSFGHEMNGFWYSWGYDHTPPSVFVAAWRHIVTLFRTAGARNVTWMWTVNIMHPLASKAARVPAPGPWWPGGSYVDWVGIDGYYYNSASTFAPMFGPTIAAVRALTHDPILISETSVAPAAGQSAKIANLFAGIRLYGVLGFVWFDATHWFDGTLEDWRLQGAASYAALRRASGMYYRPPS